MSKSWTQLSVTQSKTKQNKNQYDLSSSQNSFKSVKDWITVLITPQQMCCNGKRGTPKILRSDQFWWWDISGSVRRTVKDNVSTGTNLIPFLKAFAVFIQEPTRNIQANPILLDYVKYYDICIPHTRIMELTLSDLASHSRTTMAAEDSDCIGPVHF